MWIWPLGGKDPLKEEKATHSSILAWRIPWREECGGLLSIGLDMTEACMQHIHHLLCLLLFSSESIYTVSTYLELCYSFFVCLFAFHIFYHYQKFEFYFLIVHCPDLRVSMGGILPSFILFSQGRKLDNSLPFSILFINKAHTFLIMYSYFFLPFKLLNGMVLNLIHLWKPPLMSIYWELNIHKLGSSVSIN